MVLPLDMVLDVRAVEVDVPQIPRTVPFRLIVEVRRRGVAALAACGDGLRAHFFSKLDHGNEAVPARPVPILCAGVGARSERRKRSPDGRGEAHGNARPLILERLDNIACEALETVDVAPGRLPRSEVSCKPVRRRS